MRVQHIITLLLVVGSAGCGTTNLYRTAKNKQVLWAQGANLYRKKPYIIPAEGWVAVTKEELIFIPSVGIIGPIIFGNDSTFIKLENIERFEKKQWLFIFPNRLHVIMEDGKRYRVVTWKRDKLIWNIRQVKKDTE